MLNFGRNGDAGRPFDGRPTATKKAPLPEEGRPARTLGPHHLRFC